ncbi:hypothetical protein C8R47DRAFT_643325 [Mycena vitilis]|nr:hypothetical protein C8R47DRAFT_643325 [Mycena vitilis]
MAKKILKGPKKVNKALLVDARVKQAPVTDAQVKQAPVTNARVKKGPGVWYGCRTTAPPTPEGSFVASSSKPPVAPLPKSEDITSAALDRKPCKRALERQHTVAAIGTAKKKVVKTKALPPGGPLALPPAPVSTPIVPEPWVHVSNLDPETTPDDLRQHFARCGNLEYVNIRYSATGIPGRPEIGYRYAVVKFQEFGAVEVALDLNDHPIIGSEYKLVVKPDILHLPEVHILPEFQDSVKHNRSMFGAFSHVRGTTAPARNTHQTASGMTPTSPVVPTKIWKPDVETKRHRRRAEGYKHRIVGGVEFRLSIA